MPTDMDYCRGSNLILGGHLTLTIPGGPQVPLPGGSTDIASLAGVGQYMRSAR